MRAGLRAILTSSIREPIRRAGRHAADDVADGHGGNKELVKIANDPEKGFAYIKKHFQYTILENFNSKVDDSYILQREAWWKKVLRSKEFGYNDN